MLRLACSISLVLVGLFNPVLAHAQQAVGLPTAISVLLPAPLAAAPPETRVFNIAFLGPAMPNDSLVTGFRQGLREHGYVEGQNLLIEWRFTGGRGPEQVAEFAVDLARSKVDVIVTAGNVAAFAARDATGTIPVVFAIVHEPVAAGLVSSLARPGGNVTGIAQLGVELIGKRLELLKETFGPLKPVVIPIVRTEPLAERLANESRKAGGKLGLEVRLMDVRGTEDLQRALRTAASKSGAVCLLPSAFLYSHRRQIGELATKQRLPILSWETEFVTSGALMSYGQDNSEAGRRAAGYVDKILKGAKPADLPVEQPRRFQLTINAKAAKALGVTIPPSVLLQADRVIE